MHSGGSAPRRAECRCNRARLDSSSDHLGAQAGAADHGGEKRRPPLARLHQPGLGVRPRRGEDEARKAGAGAGVEEAERTLGEPGEGGERFGVVALEQLRDGAGSDQVDSRRPAAELLVVNEERFDRRRDQGDF